MSNIILASNSPRRKELLKFIFKDFKVLPANIDETIPKDIPANQSAEYVATQKAIAIAKDNPNELVIGCDTVVIYNDNVLGKPESKEHCFNMIKSLSGNTHLVVTGVCIVYNNKTVSFSEVTEVTFHHLTDAEILDYISTGEPFDKAGGYGIQGYGSLLVKRIYGDYFNVVGLPISKLNQTLKNINLKIE